MFSNLIEDSRAAILRAFPNRQVYLRSGGEVSYFDLTTRTQVILVGIFSIICIWGLVMLLRLLLGVVPISDTARTNRLLKVEYERRLEDAEAKYQTAQLELAQQKENFETAARNFQEKHDTIAQFMSHPLVGDALVTVADTTYNEGQVLMHPVLRDAIPRTARRDISTEHVMSTGTEADQTLNLLDSRQNNLLLSAETKTLDAIETSRAIIEATGLDVNDVLQSSPFGKGGAAPEASDMSEETIKTDKSGRIDNIRARTSEAERLEAALISLPLGHPVNADHYQTSAFGVRRDPFTRRPTMHSAVDIASYRLAPIVASADATVKYAGYKGTYGYVVELDHGNGFLTRYAHLAKTHVKRGKKVKKGDKIGGMGSSGRSTSTHLHYEVLFQGKKLDPNNFMKAGRYVQQN